MVDLKELKKLVKYLRKEGITEFKNGELEFKLSPETRPKVYKSKQNQSDVSEQVNIDTDYPTPEEMLFYSSGGMPTKEDS